METYRNAWNHDIPSPQMAIRNPRIRSHIENLLRRVADLLGLTPLAKSDAVDSAFSLAESVKDSYEFEQALKKRFVAKSDLSHMHTAIKARSTKVFEEVACHFIGSSLLDVGCGNGLVSELSKPHFAEIQLLDVMNYLSQEVDLPFVQYDEGRPFPITKTYDTVLLLTVLHHSNDPLLLLKESWKATAKRLIIIESVFGVHTQAPVGHYDLASFVEADQIAFAVVVDWLYNRVLNDNIPVPYNFTSPDGWLGVFSECGMHVAAVRNLGQDIEIAPELHFLFVLER